MFNVVVCSDDVLNSKPVPECLFKAIDEMNVNKENGVQHLISAMPKILNNYHDAKLIIAGKGGMLDELKAQVDAMGLSQKVYFTGYLNAKQVSKMYKCADISVFP